MKQVTEKEWREKAAGLAEWRKNRTSPPNLDLYRRIVSMVHVGESVIDFGCGQQYLKQCLPVVVYYIGVDPFPVVEKTHVSTIESWLSSGQYCTRTSFVMSALDNVIDLELALKALKWVSLENIVILTGIGIPPDQYHTVQVDREDLVSVLGEPFQEVELLPKVFIFEWRL